MTTTHKERTEDASGEQDRSRSAGRDRGPDVDSGGTPDLAGKEPVVDEHPVVRLQREAGNRATQRLLRSERGIQPKLRVGQPNDRYEREADRVAKAVTRLSSRSTDEGSSVSRETATPRIQQLCTWCRGRLWRGQPLDCPDCEQTLQRSPSEPGGLPTLSDEVAGEIAHARGGGQPLPPSTRTFFESRFGRDFGDVRIHDGPDAARAAESIDAKAFAYGTDLVFGEGEYRSDTREGRRLLAHELTHVVQSGGQAMAVRRQESDGDDDMVIEGEVDPRKDKLAKETAREIAKAVHYRYEKRIGEESRGIGKEALVYEINKIIDDATRNVFAGEPRLGSEDAPLLRYHLNSFDSPNRDEGVANLVLKLAVLRREVGAEKSEPFKTYLGIDPAPSGNFEYDIQIVGGTVSKGPASGVFAVIIGFDGMGSLEKGWEQKYAWNVAGLGMSLPLPITFIDASADFEVEDYWSQSNFLGMMDIGSFSVGIGKGVSIGAIKIYGDQTFPPLFFNASGVLDMSPNADISGLRGKLRYSSILGDFEDDEPKPKDDPVYRDVEKLGETRIHFATDSATVGPEQQVVLEGFVKAYRDLLKLPEGVVAVVGSASRVGEEAYNQKLSERRAAAVRAALETAYGGLIPATVDENAHGEAFADAVKGTTERSNLARHRVVYVMVSGVRRQEHGKPSTDPTPPEPVPVTQGKGKRTGAKTGAGDTTGSHGYTVQRGDTLSTIASRFDVPGGWRALWEANRETIGSNPNVIHPGQELVLPT